MPEYDERVERILEKERIFRTEEDLRTFSQYRLRSHFSSGSGRIVMSRLLKSLIWQAYERISVGKEGGILGNLRTFWYRNVKPTVSRVPKKYLPKSGAYDLMLTCFREMVYEHGLFSYSDFDFTDDNWEHRRIGEGNPGVIVFAEKTGWIRTLREIHEKYDVTIMALGGFSSALSSEYTARHVSERLSEGEVVHLIGVVDYDYSGRLIALNFRNQLEVMGLEVESLELLIKPQHFDQEEIDLFSYPLSTKEETKLKNWLRETGGIAGEARGLESEAMPLMRLHDLVEESIDKILSARR
jgi:hypothetical protein